MIVRETFPLLDKVTERFSNGRKDRLMEHEFYKAGAAFLAGEAEDVSKYYSTSRLGTIHIFHLISLKWKQKNVSRNKKKERGF